MTHEYVYWNRDQTDKCYNDEGYTPRCGPRPDEWIKGSRNGHADHVCRPVIVDAMGRKRPIVCFTPMSNGESYVTSVETVIERFQPPAGTEYKYNYPVGAEEYKHCSPGKVVDEQKYGYPVKVVEYKYSSPGRVVDEHKYSYPVRVEYRHSSPEKVGEHKPSHPVRVEEYYRHSSPANTWGRPSSPGHDQHLPPKVEDFFAKIQTEVSQVPTRPGPLSALNWRHPRNPPKPPTATAGYGEYSDHYSKDDYWNKPNCNLAIRTDVYDADDYYSRHDGDKEPTITNCKLTRPTNDIGSAMEILKDAAVPSSGQHFRLPAAGPKYTQTIDSKEAAKRYGNVGANPPRPCSTGGIVIDSKTAEEKYKGAKVR